MIFTAITQHKKGEVLFKEDSDGHWIYKVVTGQIAICRSGHSRKQIPLARLGPGEMFGEMYLFEDNKQRNASAIVISETATLELFPQDSVLEMMSHLSPNTLSIFESLSTRLLKTSSKFVELLPEKAVVNAKPALREGQFKGDGKIG